ncbi:MAG TPA: cell wall hydrolase [Xanthobacteraceae bacterium]|nr:cell wall hydrolase [Xanthobacteraceae bacterium]
MPTAIGHQDLAALVGHQRGADAGWHLIASPFGTIEAATFRYTRPVGSAVAVPLLRTVNFDPRSLDAQAWKIDEPLTARHARQIEYPAVNRAHKGDRLPAASAAPASVDPASLPQLQPIDAPAPPQPNERHVDAGADDDLILLDKPPQIPQSGAADDARPSLEAMSFLDDEAGDRSTQIYFGTGVMGSPAALQSWAPGAAPILVPPSDESGIKLSALEGADYGAEQGGETVAGKDDATRQQSPAQQLGLTGKARAHAEKCLADAVYFEARGEPLKGQQAVAQVVINRVFSGFYPHDVCGVVYQNANRHLACQFTFACEGKDLSRIDEPDMWEQAKRIAKDTLDGKIWLADIGHATHYHAYWVHPSWVHEMVRLYKFGVHTFYRPRNWGDGEDDWGPTQINSETMRPDPEVMTENPVPMPKPEAAKGSQASASPATDRGTATAKL